MGVAHQNQIIKMVVFLKMFSLLTFSSLLLLTFKEIRSEEYVQFTANNASTSHDQLMNDSILLANNHSKWSTYLNLIKQAWDKAAYEDTTREGCGGMFYSVIDSDLSIWRERGGIKREEFVNAQKLGVHYQIVNGSLYRQNQCMFGPRCQGVEHFILNIIHELPNMEIIINVFDYPKVHVHVCVFLSLSLCFSSLSCL